MTETTIVDREQNLRYLLLEEVAEVFNNPNESTVQILRRNIESCEDFARSILERGLVDDFEYQVFRHYYGGVLSGLRGMILNLLEGVYNGKLNRFSRGVYENISCLELVRLPQMFGHLRKISENGNIDYAVLLEEFEGCFEGK